MKIKSQFLVILFIAFSLLTACKSKDSDTKSIVSPLAHIVKANEVLQTTQYTYVKVTGEHSDYWLAINKTLVNVGDTYYWSAGMIMNNFTSKELNKTFDYIVFVSDFTSQPITLNMPEGAMKDGDPMMSQGMKGNEIKAVKKKVDISAAEGGITIADLFSKPQEYAGKKVKIKGEVVKYSAGIINRNWVHIQDGTEAGGVFDLVITTVQTVAVGDQVTFEGVISLNKDFGAGYKYEVIMEDAAVIDLQKL